MFKFAVMSLIVSLVAGGIGLTNISIIAKRISMVLFAIFFLGFLALLGFAYLLGAAFNQAALMPMTPSIVPLPVLALAT
jgi:uncharacterized membrane protein YtjA (UPF0391 family)